jgi:K+/H+ antiporter YhaU regulatory subunit KhtT
VRREGQLLDHPDPAAPFQAGDVVFFVGRPEALARAQRLFEARAADAIGTGDPQTTANER